MNYLDFANKHKRKRNMWKYIDEENIVNISIGPSVLGGRSYAFFDDGIYFIVVSAESKGQTSLINVQILVIGGEVKNISESYSYPNPFKPQTGDAKIKYELSRDSNIRFFIYDASGRPVKVFFLPSGTNGGWAGENIVEWDGRDMFGNYVANGAYYYFIVADGKVLGRGEMAAYR